MDRTDNIVPDAKYQTPPVTSVDLDGTIESVLERWGQRCTDAGISFPVHAFHRFAVPRIYRQFYAALDQTNGSNHAPAASMGHVHSIGPQWRRALWYVLWIIKWFIVPRKSQFYGCAFIASKKDSRAVLRWLARYASARSRSIVHFGIIADWELVLMPDVFCFPHWLYALRTQRTVNAHCRPLDDVNRLLNKELAAVYPFSVPQEYVSRRLAERVVSLRETFVRFLGQLPSDESMVALLHDSDLAGERRLYAEYCTGHGIPVVSFDHAVVFRRHLYHRRYSRFYCVWGDHQRRRVQQLHTLDDREVAVVGRPDGPFRKRGIQKGHVWVYLSSSVTEPLYPSQFRSPGFTEEMITAIKDAAARQTPPAQVDLRHHPADIRNAGRASALGTKGSAEHGLEKAELLFVDESTAAIEFLAYDIPIVIVADARGTTGIPEEYSDCFTVLRNSASVDAACTSALHTRIDWERREQCYRYFLSGSTDFNDAADSAMRQWGL